MTYDCNAILRMTEAQLKLRNDVNLKEATPQELHEALSTAVMIAISENWNKSKRSRLEPQGLLFLRGVPDRPPSLQQPV